jgi:hypothetical protein
VGLCVIEFLDLPGASFIGHEAFDLVPFLIRGGILGNFILIITHFSRYQSIITKGQNYQIERHLIYKILLKWDFLFIAQYRSHHNFKKYRHRLKRWKLWTLRKSRWKLYNMIEICMHSFMIWRILQNYNILLQLTKRLSSSGLNITIIKTLRRIIRVNAIKLLEK